MKRPNRDVATQEYIRYSKRASAWAFSVLIISITFFVSVQKNNESNAILYSRNVFNNALLTIKTNNIAIEEELTWLNTTEINPDTSLILEQHTITDSKLVMIIASTIRKKAQMEAYERFSPQLVSMGDKAFDCGKDNVEYYANDDFFLNNITGLAQKIAHKYVIQYKYCVLKYGSFNKEKFADLIYSQRLDKFLNDELQKLSDKANGTKYNNQTVLLRDFLKRNNNDKVLLTTVERLFYNYSTSTLERKNLLISKLFDTEHQGYPIYFSERTENYLYPHLNRTYFTLSEGKKLDIVKLDSIYVAYQQIFSDDSPERSQISYLINFKNDYLINNILIILLILFLFYFHNRKISERIFQNYKLGSEFKYIGFPSNIDGISKKGFTFQYFFLNLLNVIYVGILFIVIFTYPYLTQFKGYGNVLYYGISSYLKMPLLSSPVFEFDFLYTITSIILLYFVYNNFIQNGKDTEVKSNLTKRNIIVSKSVLMLFFVIVIPTIIIYIWDFIVLTEINKSSNYTGIHRNIYLSNIEYRLLMLCVFLFTYRLIRRRNLILAVCLISINCIQLYNLTKEIYYLSNPEYQYKTIVKGYGTSYRLPPISY